MSFTQAPPLSATRDFVLSNIARGVVQLVAVKGNDVIGWCDILPRESEGATHCGSMGIGVHPEHRGAGVGERLAVEAIKRARDKAFERIELEVYASNSVAKALYEKLGFVTEGIKSRARKLDGVYDDIVVMALFL